MGFWCCVEKVPKTALLFIPIVIYVWNKFLQPIWSNFWKNEEKAQIKIQTEDVSNVSKENFCNEKLENSATNDSIREKIE